MNDLLTQQIPTCSFSDCLSYDNENESAKRDYHAIYYFIWNHKNVPTIIEINQLIIDKLN